MTTSRELPRSAGTGPHRTLRAHDPAELLAQVRALLREIPRDCLALIGHRHRSSVVMCAHLPLTDAIAMGAPPMMGELLDELGRHGCTGAFALVVLGDGYGAVGQDAEGLVGACSLATAVLDAAEGRELLQARGAGAVFDIPEVWVIAEGHARPLRTDGIGHARPLRDVRDTLVEAQAVLAGEPRVRERTGDDPVVGAMRSALLGRADKWAPEVEPDTVGALWRAALSALNGLEGVPCRRDAGGRAPEPPAVPATVTHCEQVAQFLLALWRRPVRDAFLATLAQRGQELRLRRPEDVVDFMARSGHRPHESIRAGGEWYEAIARILAASRPTSRLEVGPLARGWANLAAVLALCAWWNQRLATAGRLADEVLDQDPDHELARLIQRMADAPLRPCRSPALGGP